MPVASERDLELWRGFSRSNANILSRVPIFSSPAGASPTDSMNAAMSVVRWRSMVVVVVIKCLNTSRFSDSLVSTKALMYSSLSSAKILSVYAKCAISFYQFF